MNTPTAAPGWYRDGVTPGLLRWYDGAAWTSHTTTDPHGPGLTARGASDDGPSSAVHWMLPVGRSWQSIVAGYLGLFSLGIWVLGPVAIAFGIWALVRAGSGGHGRGRAVTGIVGGAIGTLVLVAFAASSAGMA